ncbi:unnamed protein product [Pylaiella littoralis]
MLGGATARSSLRNTAVPPAAGGGGGRMRCCSHEEFQGQDGGGWVRSICVATFDVGTGHTLEQVYPADSLDEGDRQRIRMLAMPDCNTTQIGDCFYCFRTRKSHRLPLTGSSSLDQTFEYCYAFFRQQRNPECARGMFQKSVVVVSRYPYVNLFERLVKVIGPLYFTHGPAVLEAVHASVEDWPAPCPGSLCPLPFLGETVMFQVPDIDMPPQVASKYRFHRGVHLCTSWPRARVKSLTRTLSGCGSVDFAPHPSPNSLRAANSSSFALPLKEYPDEDGGGGGGGGGVQEEQQLGATRDLGGSVDGARVAVDNGTTLDAAAAAATATVATSGRGGSRAGEAAAGPDRARAAVTSGLPAIEAPATPSPRSGDDGGVGGGGAFWSGSAGNPSVLVSPGLRLSTDGAGEGWQPSARGHRRSSLGSASLASVICGSPSENWLTTPTSGSTPILTLEGRAGSNLAQSCYYVADEDSEEDEEEEEVGQEIGDEEGWHGGRWGECGDDDRSAGTRDGKQGGAGGGSLLNVVDAGNEKAAGRGAQCSSEEGRPPPLTMTYLEVASSAATAVEGASDVNAGTAGSSVPDTTAANASGGLEIVAGDAPAPAVGGVVMQPLSAALAGVVVAATTMASVSAAAAAAAAAASSAVKHARAMNDPSAAVPSRAAHPAKTGSAIPSSQGRATSLSPPRSAAPHGLAAMKSSQSPDPRSWGARSALRAWADSASEDPWDLPSPLEFVKLPASSTTATVTAAAPPPAVAVESRVADISNRRRSISPPRDTAASLARTSRLALFGEDCGKAEATAATGGGVAAAAEAAIRATRAAGVKGQASPPKAMVAGANDGGRSRVKEGQQISNDAAAAAAVAAATASDATGSGGSAVGQVQGSREVSAGGARAQVVPTVLQTKTGRSPSAAAAGVASVVTGASSTAGGGAMAGLGVGGDSARHAKEEAKRQGKGKGDTDFVRDGNGDEDYDDATPARRGSYGKTQQRYGRERRRSTSVHSRTSSADSRDMHLHRSASNLHGGRSPFAEMLLADEARFRAKQGLFQSIGLYSIFGKKLVEHLWLLWELVLTGGPTLVLGPSVGASSAAILGMVSLASPVYYAGDFRPHFTTFDPDYREIVAAHDKVSKQQLWGSSVLGVPAAAPATDASGGFPIMLLGVINPIFLRTLSRWPNAIVLPGAAGRGATAGKAGFHKLQKNLSDDFPSGSPRNRNCPTPKDGLAATRAPRVRVQVVRAAASLDQVVGLDDRADEPIIVARQQPVMIPDVAVLSRLLDPGTPFSPATAAAATAAAAASTSGAGGQPPTPIAGVVAAAAEAARSKGGPETKGQWKDSLRAINDIILRRHFNDLTRSFLAPFDQYFRKARPPQTLSAWQQRALARLSVYTEAEVLLPRFDPEEFLTEMFVAGPPKAFVHVQWETLYRRFMDGPNFKPWFTTQRIEAVDRIRESSRALCLRTTPRGMVEACTPARLPQLMSKMRASIAREWERKGKSVDWDLLERMEQHQKAVAAAIIARTAGGAANTATGSMQP